MTPLNVLVLTDHAGHSDQNSIYALVKEMVGHEQVGKVSVASRGLDINRGFFVGQEAQSLFAASVGQDFAYHPDGRSMTVQLSKVVPSQVDIVFMRLPRPISDDFLRWLEVVFHHSVIVNKPSGIIKTSSKAFLLQVPEVCAPVQLVTTADEVYSLADSRDIVLKPLHEYGGRGIVKVTKTSVDDGAAVYSREAYLDTLVSSLNTSGYLAMDYLHQVSQGDKRILVVGGEIMAASLRLPAKDSWLCNVAQGGTSVGTEVLEEERAIIRRISPILLAQGILIYGADTLMGNHGKRVLSEVNTLSIGGFPQAQQQSGLPIIKKTIDKILDYAIQQRG